MKICAQREFVAKNICFYMLDFKVLYISIEEEVFAFVFVFIHINSKSFNNSYMYELLKVFKRYKPIQHIILNLKKLND
jgi:hypothetical protein